MQSTKQVAICDFCDLADGTIVMESENFIVKVSLGALVEGWLLVIPRTHMLALAAMPADIESEYNNTVARCRMMLEPYGRLVEFEHGPGRAGNEVGCTVDHAHLHLVPSELDLLTKARTMLPQATWRPVQAIAELLPEHAAQQAYLFLRQDGQAYATTADAFPSQLFRRIIAQELALGEFDWRKNSRPLNIRATLEALAI